MKKTLTLLIASALILLSSCIFFLNINQPSVSLPNESVIFCVNVTTEGGDYEPYFGVSLPIGWIVIGDSLKCGGAYNEVIYYDSLISFEQENASPAPESYYWWAGKGAAVSTMSGNVYADVSIQTDNQIGLVLIPIMTAGLNWLKHRNK